MNLFYIYALLDPRYCGPFWYEELGVIFDYLPIYIGKGKGSRCYDHFCKSNLKEHNYKNNLIKKIFNETNHFPSVKIIEKDLSEEISFRLEKFYISIIGRTDLKTGPLVNMNDGGIGGTSGRIITEQIRNNMRISHLGKNKGIDNPNFGNPSNWSPSVELRLQISNANKNKILSEETKTKMSRAQKGRILSKNHIKQMSELNIKKGLWKGEKNPWYGKGHLISGEKSPHSKIFIFRSPNTILTSPIFNLEVFCKNHYLNYSCMVSVSNGRRSHHRGYTIHKVYTKNEWELIQEHKVNDY